MWWRTSCAPWPQESTTLKVLDDRHLNGKSTRFKAPPPNAGSGLGSPVQYDGRNIQGQYTAYKQGHDVQVFSKHCRFPQMHHFLWGLAINAPVTMW